MKKLQFIRVLVSAFAIALTIFLTAGCVNPGGGSGGNERSDEPRPRMDSDVILVGDLLKVTFSGPSIQIQDHEERVSTQGTITLPHIGPVEVAGKSRVEVQNEIQERYVPEYYRTLTVTIVPEQRFFYVGGEVEQPGRIPYADEITVLGAISAASGFTDFANERKVLLTRRDGKRIEVDCRRARENPTEYDLEVLPGDQIFVPQRWY